jgi:hypothetical protein
VITPPSPCARPRPAPPTPVLPSAPVLTPAPASWCRGGVGMLAAPHPLRPPTLLRGMVSKGRGRFRSRGPAAPARVGRGGRRDGGSSRQWRGVERGRLHTPWLGPGSAQHASPRLLFSGARSPALASDIRHAELQEILIFLRVNNVQVSGVISVPQHGHHSAPDPSAAAHPLSSARIARGLTTIPVLCQSVHMVLDVGCIG